MALKKNEDALGVELPYFVQLLRHFAAQLDANDANRNNLIGSGLPAAHA